MQSLQDIRHRSRSIRDIRHITKAMSMLSTIRLRQAELHIGQARPFARRINEVLINIAALVGGEHHPLMAERAGGRSAFVIYASDRGLCGSFNDNVISLAFDFIEQNELAERACFLVVGKVGADALRSRGITFSHGYFRPGKRPTFSLATEIAADIMKLFLGEQAEERVDEVFLVYSRFYSSLEQRPRVFRLLPIVPLVPSSDSQLLNSESTCLFEPSAESVLEHLVPRYIETTIYRALLESDASEQAARLTAMSAATDNADRIISELSILYNRSRQSEITEEIADIIGGSEALLKGDLK